MMVAMHRQWTPMEFATQPQSAPVWEAPRLAPVPKGSEFAAHSVVLVGAPHHWTIPTLRARTVTHRLVCFLSVKQVKTFVKFDLDSIHLTLPNHQRVISEMTTQTVELSARMLNLQQLQMDQMLLLFVAPTPLIIWFWMLGMTATPWASHGQVPPPGHGTSTSCRLPAQLPGSLHKAVYSTSQALRDTSSLTIMQEDTTWPARTTTTASGLSLATAALHILQSAPPASKWAWSLLLQHLPQLEL